MPRVRATGDKRRLAEWRSAVQSLIGEVESWAKAEGWQTARQMRRISERALGSYEVADLSIKVPGGTVVVEVKGGDVPRADGRVDLYAWPQLHRMLLVRRGSEWIIKTDAGVPWPKPWSRKAFTELARTLTQAA